MAINVEADILRIVDEAEQGFRMPRIGNGNNGNGDLRPTSFPIDTLLRTSDLSLTTNDGTVETPPIFNEFEDYHRDPDMVFEVRDENNEPLRLPFLREVRPINELIELKRQKGKEVIVVIPTRNEGSKEGKPVSNIGGTLDNILPLIEAGLVDKIFVIDSGSTDDTESEVRKRMQQQDQRLFFIQADDVARDNDRMVEVQKEIVNEAGQKEIVIEKVPERGKGFNIAIASAAFSESNQVLCIFDADFNGRASQVQAAISPLIEDDNVELNKTILRRLTHQGSPTAPPAGGGRVTELLFHPTAAAYEDFIHMQHILQPLGGIFAFRGDALAKIKVPNGYDLETRTLLVTWMNALRDRTAAFDGDKQKAVDDLEFHHQVITQTYAGTFEQTGQSVEGLRPMSSVIITEIEEVGRNYNVNLNHKDGNVSFIQYPIHRENGVAVIKRTPVTKERREYEHGSIKLDPALVLNQKGESYIEYRVEREPVTKKRVIVTDMDGTFLDKETYTVEDAADAILRAGETETPINYVTSKTAAEVIKFQSEMEYLIPRAPFIPENGGAIYIPHGFFSFDVSDYFPAEFIHDTENYTVVELGARYQEVCNALHAVADAQNVEVIGINDMTVEQFAEYTGLSLEKAALAKQREHQEGFLILERDSDGKPIIIKDPNNEKVIRMRRGITQQGYAFTEGGKFWQIYGVNGTKRVATEQLLNLYNIEYGNEIDVWGFGDAEADIDFVAACDHGYILENPQKPIDLSRNYVYVDGGENTWKHQEREEYITIHPEEGPQGWNTVVLNALQ